MAVPDIEEQLAEALLEIERLKSVKAALLEAVGELQHAIETVCVLVLGDERVEEEYHR